MYQRYAFWSRVGSVCLGLTHLVSVFRLQIVILVRPLRLLAIDCSSSVIPAARLGEAIFVEKSDGGSHGKPILTLRLCVAIIKYLP